MYLWTLTFIFPVATARQIMTWPMRCFEKGDRHLCTCLRWDLLPVVNAGPPWVSSLCMCSAGKSAWVTHVSQHGQSLVWNLEVFELLTRTHSRTNVDLEWIRSPFRANLEWKGALAPGKEEQQQSLAQSHAVFIIMLFLMPSSRCPHEMMMSLIPNLFLSLFCNSTPSGGLF